MNNRLLVLILIFNCNVISCQNLSVYSELLRADSIVSYLRNFEGKIYLDYKSYNIDAFNIEGDSLVDFLPGDREPSLILVTRTEFFRDKRPFMSSFYLLDYQTKDTLNRIRANVSFQNDTLIEFRITNYDTLTGYEQYSYDKRYRDYNSFISLYPNKDTITYRTLSFKNNIADILFQYDTIIGVSPKVWYNSYTEKYFYKNNLIDSVVRTQYNPDGSEWVIFPEKFCRDQNNRLYYVKLYLIPDPALGEQEFDGYINVYGAKIPNLVPDTRRFIKSNIYSVADKIKWDSDIILNNKSLVIINSIDGKHIQALPIDQLNQSCSWPKSIPMGLYSIIIRTEEKTYSQKLMKNQ